MKRFTLILSLFALALSIAAVALNVYSKLPSQTVSEPYTMHDSLGVTYTYDGEAIRWYVFADPDTGIEYLVNDRGGCVERGNDG